MHWGYKAAFIAALLIEGLVTTLPLVWILLLVGSITSRKALFFYAGIAGLVLDMFAVGFIPYRSIVLIVMVLIVFLYERKFEIQTIPFVIFSSFLGSMAFLFIFHYNEILIQSSVCVVIATGLFQSLRLTKSTIE